MLSRCAGGCYTCVCSSNNTAPVLLHRLKVHVCRCSPIRSCPPPPLCCAGGGRPARWHPCVGACAGRPWSHASARGASADPAAGLMQQFLFRWLCTFVVEWSCRLPKQWRRIGPPVTSVGKLHVHTLQKCYPPTHSLSFVDCSVILLYSVKNIRQCQNLCSMLPPLTLAAVCSKRSSSCVELTARHQPALQPPLRGSPGLTWAPLAAAAPPPRAPCTPCSDR